MNLIYKYFLTLIKGGFFVLHPVVICGDESVAGSVENIARKEKKINVT